MQPFDLLSLPSVALRKTLRSCNPIELFELAQCSKKAAEKIKLVGLKHFKLYLNFRCGFIRINDDFLFRVHKKSSNAINYLSTRCIGNEIVPVAISDCEILNSYWENGFIGLKSLFFHLSELFNCPIERLESCFPDDTAVPDDVYLSTIDFIRKRQSEIKRLHISSATMRETDVEWILKNLKVSEQLEIFANLGVNFGTDLSFDTKSITISESSWVSLKTLESMKNCIAIKLSRSTLTNKDIEIFFQQWIAGEYNNLQLFTVTGEVLNENLTIGGLNALEDLRNPNVISKTICEQTLVIYGGVPIKRIDGVTGTIRFNVKNQSIFFIL